MDLLMLAMVHLFIDSMSLLPIMPPKFVIINNLSSLLGQLVASLSNFDLALTMYEIFIVVCLTSSNKLLRSVRSKPRSKSRVKNSIRGSCSTSPTSNTKFPSSVETSRSSCWFIPLSTTRFRPFAKGWLSCGNKEKSSYVHGNLNPKPKIWE